jgi:putative tricarboxylic transport membrane protein
MTGITRFGRQINDSASGRRRAMMISFGDPMVLITRPLSAAFLFAALALLVAIALPALRAKREEAMQE